MTWTLSHRADPRAKVLADRHYNRQTPEADQFVPPGRCVVLLQPHAFWVTSWPFAAFTAHAWAGAWVCSAFRREGGTTQASEMIREAIAITRWRWPTAPSVSAARIHRRAHQSDLEPIDICMVTFVDPAKVTAKRDPGRCFLRAGFVEVGHTRERGRLALGLPVDAMPEARAPLGGTLSMFAGAE